MTASIIDNHGVSPKAIIILQKVQQHLKRNGAHAGSKMIQNQSRITEKELANIRSCGDMQRQAKSVAFNPTSLVCKNINRKI